MIKGNSVKLNDVFLLEDTELMKQTLECSVRNVVLLQVIFNMFLCKTCFTFFTFRGVYSTVCLYGNDL